MDWRRTAVLEIARIAESPVARWQISVERLENHRKLIREQDFLRRKIDPKEQQKAKRFIRSTNRTVRQLYQEREKKGKP